MRKLTDERSWRRGVDYFERGRVRRLVQDGATVVARVDGTRPYKVTLRVEDGGIYAECTCPMGDAGVFCKHCVAVGLVYLHSGTGETGEDNAPGAGRPHARSHKKDRPITTLDDVREFLSEQDTSALVEIIVEQAMQDERLLHQLLLKAARHRGGAVNVAAFRHTITEATDMDGFVDYYCASGFAAGIGDVVDSIAELLTEGHADEVIELTEHALERVEHARGYTDDSEGEMQGILERLQELHHAACVAVRPDPASLARRVFHWEMSTDWDTFYNAAETYADVFSQEGLATYCRLAEAEWEKMPQLAPGQREKAYEGHRFRLTSIMESLARVKGDLEALVAIKTRDLSSAYRYLEIAQIYKEAGKRDEALNWAEKGLRAFPDQTDSRLREFLADEYHRRKRHDEAMTLVWDNFVDSPYLGSYEQLKEHAKRAGQWPDWREQALSHIRKQIREQNAQTRQTRPPWEAYPRHSELVEILVWEKEVEAAWVEAQVGGCSTDQWLELAGLREKEHPADALSVYLGRIAPIVERTNNDAYREAIGLIRKVGKLMSRLGRQDEFAEYLRSLRSKYRRKRNFIAMLAQIK